MEIPGDSESLCLDKFQREAFLCLNTFPEKVTELNILIDEFTPEAMKKSQGDFTHKPPPSCLSINSLTSDYHFHDVGSCYSATTYRDRCKSRNGICKRKYRAYLRRRSRPLAHILAILANRLAICTRVMLIKPSTFIIDIVTTMFLQKEQMKHIQCGTSTVWKALNSKDNNCSALNNLICTIRPAAVRLIADTTILKRWLQALALASNLQNQSLSQAIRTTETIDGWAYELFFHLKYLQVIHFSRTELGNENARKLPDKELLKEKVVEPAAAAASMTILPVNDMNVTYDVMHTNLWHRIVQLRDHYVILFDILKSNNQFLESDEAKNVCPVSD